jgi:hypothetical protein
MTIYEQKISDEDFKKYHGKNFGECWYNFIINTSSDGYYHDSSGNKNVLFIFRKRKIPEKLRTLAIDTFLKESKKKHSNRGVAAGVSSDGNARHYTSTGQSEGKYISSNISGYFDRPLREHRGTLGTIVACRRTAFTLNNEDLWKNGLPFVKYCSKLYSLLGGKYYRLQKKEYHSINDLLKIPKTVFTTITSNYNWRTACHCDSGDFSKGLGNLVVVGHGFKGGYLGFPQFKVLIKIEPGDFLLMDVHQWHCNTPITITTNDGFRLSFVMYIRSDMSKCSKVKTVSGTKYLTQ